MTRQPYSAKVNLMLEVNGETLSLAQVGSDFAILREARPDLLGREGVIVVTIDGDPRRHPVWIVAMEGKRIFIENL